ncbi:GNAT family N-acetyltransferase [Acidithiobacillus ferridurans]|uniref:GNAT family N-acetyltransferase n=1 Tax=Acidithiobacillus ferridurans TaxID=1232575 RepID=UPI001C07579A|nr:N-acetyltransferase [Acidithiobacillus ferridurans]MBU2804437.1 GNAT family N-acetyltransferase [Acidithiobacillus ferridurans]
MTSNFSIQRATASDAHEVAIMVGGLLHEIMSAVGMQAFNFNLHETSAKLKDFIDREKYFVFIAIGENTSQLGFIALYESYALYAEGAFGTIAELFVRPGYRSQDIGRRLIEQAKSFGNSRGWKRLEVTTPPLPQFDRALAFYEKEGFAITGGRKLKVAL